MEIGKVEELLPGADGNVRGALVRVRNGILRRLIQRLYPLEVKTSETVLDAPQENPTAPVLSDSTVSADPSPVDAPDTSPQRADQTPRR